MKRIELDGVIGYDVLAADIRKQLGEGKGEDIDLIVSSSGGSVWEGLSIYNAIRDYRRSGGKVVARVVGIAGSMASYIPMAADSLIAEDNAIFFIHNPWMVTAGDTAEHMKAAEELERLSAMLAVAYSQKSGRSIPEVRKEMSDETFYYGQEMVDAGYADGMVMAGEGPESRDDAVVYARERLRKMQARINEAVETEASRHLDAAALIRPASGLLEKSKSTAVKAEKEAVMPDNTDKSLPIFTLDDFKRERPDIYAQAKVEGVHAERERVAELISCKESDPDNEALALICDEALKEGKTVYSVQAQINVAIRDWKPAVDKDTESSPVVKTVNPTAQYSSEDLERAESLNMNIDSYMKCKRYTEKNSTEEAS